MKKLLCEENGSVMVFIVIGLTILLGMAAVVLDGGMQYVTKSRLQNAVDAAALAGAQDLTKDSTGALAKATALSYLGQNGVGTTADDTIPPPVVADSNGSHYTKITVTVTRKVPFGLAKIFGNDFNDVSALATVQLKTVTGMSGLAPIGALETECMFNGEVVTLKCNGNSDIPTTTGKKWRGWVRLDGEQGAGYAEVIEEGCDETVEIGQLWDTQTGTVNAKPVRDVIMELVNGCEHDPKCTASAYVEGCPRIVYLPVVETDDTGKAVFNQGDQVKIAGFAAFILVDYYDDQFIKGYFIHDVAPGDVNNNGAPNFGVYTAKLVQ